MREYTSEAPADGGPAQATLPEITFRLDGEVFTARQEMDGDSLLAWSELALAGSDEVPANSPEAQSFIARFLLAAFGREEYARLRRHIRANGTPVPVVYAIVQGVQQEMAEMVEDMTGRPTGPSSPSLAGPEGQGGSTVRPFRLSEIGDVVEAPPPPPKRARRASSGR
jgi:hypothetical protein